MPKVTFTPKQEVALAYGRAHWSNPDLMRTLEAVVNRMSAQSGRPQENMADYEVIAELIRGRLEALDAYDAMGALDRITGGHEVVLPWDETTRSYHAPEPAINTRASMAVVMKTRAEDVTYYIVRRGDAVAVTNAQGTPAALHYLAKDRASPMPWLLDLESARTVDEMVAACKVYASPGFDIKAYS